MILFFSPTSYILGEIEIMVHRCPDVENPVLKLTESAESSHGSYSEAVEWK